MRSTKDEKRPQALLSWIRLDCGNLLRSNVIRIWQQLSSDENTTSLRRTSEAGKASSPSTEVSFRSDGFSFLRCISHGTFWCRCRSKTRQRLRFWEGELRRKGIEFHWWKCQLQLWDAHLFQPVPLFACYGTNIRENGAKQPRAFVQHFLRPHRISSKSVLVHWCIFFSACLRRQCLISISIF